MRVKEERYEGEGGRGVRVKGRGVRVKGEGCEGEGGGV